MWAIYKRFCPVCRVYHFASMEEWDEITLKNICHVPKLKRQAEGEKK